MIILQVSGQVWGLVNLVSDSDSSYKKIRGVSLNLKVDDQSKRILVPNYTRANTPIATVERDNLKRMISML